MNHESFLPTLRGTLQHLLRALGKSDREGLRPTRYSRIPLSRAPLTRENQLVALAPWTPNFSDAPLATARMTDR